MTRQAIIVTCATLAIATAARAVQFDFNTGSSPTQSGYVGVTTAGVTGVASDVGTLDLSFTGLATLTPPDRDRMALASTEELSHLGRDFIFGQTATSPSLDVTLAGVNAGKYVLTGYFHDRDFVQGTMDVSISTDGGATFALALDDILASTTTTPGGIARGSFALTADGTNDLVLRIVSNGNGGSAPAGNHLINGFDLMPFPDALHVDFNELTAPGSPTQSGYYGVTTAGATGLLTGIGAIDVSLTGVAPTNPDRDRGAMDPSQPLGDLGRDFIFGQTTASPSTDITLHGILAGQYEFTGYFHDNTVVQGTSDVFVSVDGGATFAPALDNVLYSTGTNPAAIGMGSFLFETDGLSDVVVRIVSNADAGSSTGNHLINGFDVTRVPAPEPASALLLAAGLLGLGRATRRRRA